MSDEIVGIKERIVFYRLGGQTPQLLQEAWRVLEKHLPTILDSFYTHLASQSETRSFLASNDIECLKNAQTSH